jgi:HSP20 family protein
MTKQTHAWGSNFSKLADHMRAMLDEMQTRNYFGSHGPDTFQPAVNLYDTTTSYHVCVDIAGMPRTGIDVRVDNGSLYIRGERAKPELPDDANEVGVTLMEIDSGRFQRKLPLPDDVAVDDIAARYKDGYLWISLPRNKASG